VLGSAFGMVNLGGMIGAFLAPMVMGYLIEVFNGYYASAFIYIIVCAVIGIFAAATLNSKKDSFGQAPLVTSEKTI